MPITHEEFKDNCTIIKKSITPVYDKLDITRMTDFNQIKNISGEIDKGFYFLKVLKLIMLDYLEDDVLFLKLNRLAEKDFCLCDCQGTYDPPQPICSPCRVITDLINKLENIYSKGGQKKILVRKNYQYIIK